MDDSPYPDWHILNEACKGGSHRGTPRIMMVEKARMMRVVHTVPEGKI